MPSATAPVLETMSQDRNEHVDGGANVRALIHAGHYVVQLGDGRIVHRGSCPRCAIDRAARIAGERAVVLAKAPAAVRDMIRNGHQFDDIGEGYLVHRDGCQRCVADRAAQRAAEETPEAQARARRETAIMDRVNWGLSWSLGIGFVLLVVWLAITDPIGITMMIPAMVLSHILWALNAILCLGGCY